MLESYPVTTPIVVTPTFGDLNLLRTTFDGSELFWQHAVPPCGCQSNPELFFDLTRYADGVFATGPSDDQNPASIGVLFGLPGVYSDG